MSSFKFWNKPDDYNKWCLNYPKCSNNCNKLHNFKVCITEQNLNYCYNPYCIFTHFKRSNSYELIKKYETELEEFVEFNFKLSNFSKNNINNNFIKNNINNDSIKNNINNAFIKNNINNDSIKNNINNDSIKNNINNDSIKNNLIIQVELINKVNLPINNEPINILLKQNNIKKRKYFEHVLNKNKIICINTKKSTNNDNKKIKYIKTCINGPNCYYYKHGKCKFYH